MKLPQQNASSQYQTNLNPGQDFMFDNWAAKNNVPVDLSPHSDYDIKGFFKALMAGKVANSSISPTDGRPHFPDTYKTPYHRTLSNESIYAGANAPHWEGNKLLSPNGDAIHVDLPEGQ